MNLFLDRFETGFNRFTHFCAALVAISIALIAFLIPLNLFMVKAQLGGIWWLFEGVEYVLYCGVFIGAPWVLQKNAHVKVDVQQRPRHLRKIGRLFRTDADPPPPNRIQH